MKKLIDYFTENQKSLLLIDSIGAIVTAFFLFVVMRQFNEYFGMPETVLTYLAAIAFCFFIYSTSCFLFLKGGWTPFIRLIGIANILYCALTIVHLYKYYPILTTKRNTIKHVIGVSQKWRPQWLNGAFVLHI